MVNPRNKGAAFERKVCKIFEKYTGKKFNRTPGSGAFSTNVGDKRLAGDIYCIEQEFPWIIECKKYKDFNLEDIIKQNSTGILKWITQLKSYCKRYNKPGMLIIEKNYGKPILFVETKKDLGTYLEYDGFVIGLLEEILPKLFKKG